MTTFLLVRHGHNDMVDRGLAGRLPIPLNSRGRAEAEATAARLAQVPVRQIFSSPMERSRETAAPLARLLGLDVRPLEELNEIDFGDWAGCGFDELNRDPVWKQFNTFRSGTRIPGGELMVEVQKRMVTALERLRREFPQEVIALFSHGDPIKSAIGHYAGIPLDFALRLEISLASVSVMAIHDSGPRIFCINNTGESFPFFN